LATSPPALTTAAFIWACVVPPAKRTIVVPNGFRSLFA